jgi:hypothetical protein
MHVQFEQSPSLATLTPTQVVAGAESYSPKSRHHEKPWKNKYVSTIWKHNYIVADSRPRKQPKLVHMPVPKVTKQWQWIWTPLHLEKPRLDWILHAE